MTFYKFDKVELLDSIMELLDRESPPFMSYNYRPMVFGCLIKGNQEIYLMEKLVLDNMTHFIDERYIRKIFRFYDMVTYCSVTMDRARVLDKLVLLDKVH